MKSKLTKEQTIYLAKVFGMWFVGFLYFAAALEIDTYYSRGALITMFFAALWLPIRWDRHMPKELIKESWADKNVIHS